MVTWRFTWEKRIAGDKIRTINGKMQGYWNLTPGNKIHYKFVDRFWNPKRGDIYLYKVGYDAWSWLISWRNGRPPGEDVREPVIQGKKTLSLSQKPLGVDLSANKIIYNNNPILNGT